MNTYKAARKRAGLSIEEAAFRLHIAPRTLQNYENITTPPADVVLGMSREYRAPELTNSYGREVCAIGRAFSYEVLDNVDSSLPCVILKLISEMEEAQKAMNKLIWLSVNKKTRSDFTETEWAEFTEALQVFFDVEHNIEVLKLTLAKMTDVSELIHQHNQKCLQRGYTKRKTAI